MTDGSQFIDIILFAMVAVFLGLRLRSVLGRRTGEERRPDEAPLGRKTTDNVVPLPSRPVQTGFAPNGAADPAGNSLDAGLAAIQQADPNFSPQAFLQGAAAAFEMIVQAFARGDEATLRPLLADEVFANFSKAIADRRTAREVSKSELVRIVSVDFEGARLDGRKADIGVRFVSEQVIAVFDAEGKLIEGNSNHSVKITDVWNFARDVRASDPNWLLVATRSRDE